jgi:hypothetical protein
MSLDGGDSAHGVVDNWWWIHRKGINFMIPAIHASSGEERR